MKVLYHYDVGPWLRDRLNRMAQDEGLIVTICSERDHDGFLEQIADTDVLLHNLEPVKDEHMAAAPRLKLVQKIGVGVNTIDLDAAKKRGVAVCNMPGTNSQAVSEMTLLLMLACLRRLPVFHARTARGDGWGWPPAMQDTLGEIAGRTVGLVGNGSVPQLLTPVLKAMGATVIFTKRGDPDPAIPGWVDKATLLAESDIVSLHIPLVPETRHWLDGAALAGMKPGAILVNTARGPLVDEEALAAALSSGRLMGAGLDVFAEEPSPAGNPLFALDNVVLAPHVAFFTLGTLERSLAVAVENIARLRDGRDLLHRVA
ncbi:MAG: 2-hydroxyacid dehydrogenase [Alphaproteobacteria bacterium]|nr:2-hydroxyacid dehydrogenase [Alphaproteobacteria bacterium]